MRFQLLAWRGLSALLCTKRADTRKDWREGCLGRRRGLAPHPLVISWLGLHRTALPCSCLLQATASLRPHASSMSCIEVYSFSQRWADQAVGRWCGITTAFRGRACSSSRTAGKKQCVSQRFRLAGCLDNASLSPIITAEGRICVKPYRSGRSLMQYIFSHRAEPSSKNTPIHYLPDFPGQMSAQTAAGFVTRYGITRLQWLVGQHAVSEVEMLPIRSVMGETDSRPRMGTYMRAQLASQTAWWRGRSPTSTNSQRIARADASQGFPTSYGSA